MAIFPVTEEDIEFFSTLINPNRSYSSSSAGPVGTINLFPRHSSIEKEVIPLTSFSSSLHNDENLETFRMTVAQNAKATVVSGSFFPGLQTYLTKVNSQQASVKKQKVVEIDRFTPTPTFTSKTIKKLNIKDMLMPYYSHAYPSAYWGYTNYNVLNFFSTTNVPTSSVLLYPSVQNQSIPTPYQYASGTYQLSGAFSFDFRINPRYKTDDITPNHFKAGTIFHLSSSYALSLITGSKKDENGLPTAFRLQLQLSHSANIPPSLAKPGSYPNDLIFLSDDNSLQWNEWNRVVVRWGTDLINDGIGSFNIDGVDRGTFKIPSGTISPKAFTTGQKQPNVLCLGNFYEGSNTGVNAQEFFFSDVVAERDGLEQLVDSAGTVDQPQKYAFNHPLKAELHEIIIRREYLSNAQITATSGSGLGSIDQTKIALYVPPFFVSSTPIRKYVNDHGGILQTPFFEIDGSTNDPFNVSMAFGVNGHYINLENFVKDFANEIFPRLHHLSGTTTDYSAEALVVDDLLHKLPFVTKRNLTILPCDDGKFVPNYGMLVNEPGDKFVDSFNRINYSVISLENLLSTGSLLFGKEHDTENGSSFAEIQIGPTPTNPGLPPGPALQNYKNIVNNLISSDAYDPGISQLFPLMIFQNTKDPSSNQVTIFNISNLYYGNRIAPGSFILSDSNISGSSGRISITLKDDGLGNIYRADCDTTQCSWNSVGNIFYDEGVVVIKSPHLYFFGKDQYEMSFKGEQFLHSQKYEILAPPGLLNSSSNPSYARVQTSISASIDPLDTDTFVYISNLNFHDENLNVVAKAVLAQPVLKREGEKLLFKVAFDF